ncbi:MAG: hypothetical protein H7Z40_11770 [Phycisphaerae bacterium]|nr:hypothetical protein [Gemmatimonadaceae bacterium]
MKRFRRTTLLALLAPLALSHLAACSDDGNFTQDATRENVTNRASVYALTGSGPELAAAYSIANAAFVRPTLGQSSGQVNFEIAFDIQPDGKVLLIPVRAVIPFPPQPLTGAPSIGLLKSGAAFELVTKAATSGYVSDTTAVASAGDTYLYRLNSSGCIYGEPYYGKLVLDSVIVSQRRIVVRALTNRNCGGYRSLIEGLPKN